MKFTRLLILISLFILFLINSVIAAKPVDSTENRWLFLFQDDKYITYLDTATFREEAVGDMHVIDCWLIIRENNNQETEVKSHIRVCYEKKTAHIKKVRMMYYKNNTLIYSDDKEGPWEDVAPETNSEIISQKLLDYSNKTTQ